jgi:hypothetical protein
MRQTRRRAANTPAKVSRGNDVKRAVAVAVAVAVVGTVVLVVALRRGGDSVPRGVVVRRAAIAEAGRQTALQETFARHWQGACELIERGPIAARRRTSTRGALLLVELSTKEQPVVGEAARRRIQEH